MNHLPKHIQGMLLFLPVFIIFFTVSVWKYTDAASPLPEHGQVFDVQKCKSLGRLQGNHVVAEKGTRNKFQFSVIQGPKGDFFFVREHEGNPNMMQKGDCIIAKQNDFQNAKTEICCTETKYQMVDGKPQEICTKRTGIPTNQEGNLSSPASPENCLTS